MWEQVAAPFADLNIEVCPPCNNSNDKVSQWMFGENPSDRATIQSLGVGLSVVCIGFECGSWIKKQHFPGWPKSWPMGCLDISEFGTDKRRGRQENKNKQLTHTIGPHLARNGHTKMCTLMRIWCTQTHALDIKETHNSHKIDMLRPTHTTKTQEPRLC